METFDLVIVGAGIAGVSLAWQLVEGPAERPAVLLLEMEPQPGQHSTGRSAAMFMESYGSPQGRALTRASRATYATPPAAFGGAVLAPRGALYVAWQGQQALLDAQWAALQDAGGVVQQLDARATLERVPVLKPQGLIGCIDEPDAQDIDVHLLHQGLLRLARAGGVQLWCDAALQAARHDGRQWQLQLADGRVLRAARLVNAAGGWADGVAQACGVRPLGITPHRRSAFTFAAPEGLDVRAWPLVGGVDDSPDAGWYFKPDAGRLLGSPANADATHAHDVQPEELDIAQAIHRIGEVSALQIRRPLATWAGLRSFAPDGEMVIGPDARQPAFFWLAGQGGWGIQSAAGAAMLAAALLRETALPEPLRAAGVKAEAVAPARLAGG